ncbi:MAG: leucine-rich repeat domain-containing protein, partial [Muribaculaceae bacterium]|nr:leucine-rich repeat domain-containing protein [Muribaculaceae bacterium]
MKHLLPFSQWLLSFFCILFTLPGFSAEIRIDGYEPICTYQGYPLYFITESPITVSSSSGIFNYVYIDDTKVDYDSYSYWDSYKVTISSYLDGTIHKLELNSPNGLGTCYFSSSIERIEEIEGIVYELTEDKAIVVGVSSREITKANIMSSIEKDGKTYPVTSINNSAFYGCSSLDSISIPASVMSIGNYAFDGCSALKDINLEDGETELTLGYNNSSQYYGIFYNCPLEKIHIGRNLSYKNSSTYNSPLYNQNKLTDVTIGENVTSLGYSLFYGCSSLASLSIPVSVTSIGDYAFDGCSALKDINLEDGETELTLGHGKKNNNSSQYYYGIFYDCTLEKIHIGRNLSYKNNYTYNSPLYNQNKLTDITIGENVTSLGYALFYGCSSLASLSIPASVTSIGNSAFYGCSSLTSLSIPASVTSIGDSAFNGCSALKDINLEDGETELTLGYNNSSQYYGIFYNCPLEKIHIGRNLSYKNSSTYNSPLYNQNKLTDVTIGENVTSLGYSLFYGCSSLASLSIPVSVTSIGDYAFDGCSALKDINLEDGETELTLGHGKKNNNSSQYYYGIFYDCTLEKIHIGRNLSYKNNYTYNSPLYNQNKLTDITIGENVTSLGYALFYGCSSLASLSIPASVTSIG